MAFFKSGLSNDQTAPDLQIHFLPANINDSLKKAGNFQESLKNIPKGHFVMIPTILNPHSVGSLKLVSSNPFDSPALDPAYLADKRDFEIIKVGIKKTRELVKTKEFSAFAGPEIKIDMIKSELESEEYLNELIKQMCNTFYHPG